MFAKKIASRLASAATVRGKVLISLIAAITLLCLLTSFVVLRFNRVTVIEDGKEIAAFTTAQTEQARLLEIAGVTPGGEDKVEMTVSGNNIAISIKRAFPVTITADEHIITVMVTEGHTVAQVLKMAGVSLGDKDRLSADKTTLVSAGMEISLVRCSARTVTVTKELDFAKVTEKTDELYVGESKIKQEGKNGEQVLTYEVVYEDGKEISRKLVKTTVTKAAADEIKLVGTKEKKTVAPAKNGGSVDLGDARMIKVTATAYCNTSDGGQLTAMGKVPTYGTVAVDPSVIPLGSKLYICSADGSYVYGYAVAGDTGGAIKGNKIDLFLGSESECRAFGRRQMCVYILN